MIGSYKGIITTGRHSLLLVHGRDKTLRNVFHYLAINHIKMKIFQKNALGKNVKLSDYGHILYSAYGLEPTLTCQEEIKERFTRLYKPHIN